MGKMKKKLQILVCCHKADSNIRTTSPYVPIQVGKLLHPELDLGYMTDADGDNISEKNAGWSELSAIYWGWKNINDVEYLGLNHYRRYFDIDINEGNVDDIMNGYDILTVDDYIGYEFNMNMLGLIGNTSREDAYLYVDAMIGMHPECKQEIIDYFFNCNHFTPFTMFLAKKDVYDDFCEFIFPVLYELEKKILPHNYVRQKRVMGYFGEVSLGVYIMCKHLKTKKVPFIMCDASNHTPSVRYSKFDRLKIKLKLWRKRQNHKRVTQFNIPSDIISYMKYDHIKLLTVN